MAKLDDEQMRTRQEYMNGVCTHEEYYRQFVTPEIVEFVKRRIGESSIRASVDPYFNDIPLCRWDAMVDYINSVCGPKLNKAGDGLSLAGAVCIAKVAARTIKDSII